jgi:hypothetical protein
MAIPRKTEILEKIKHIPSEYLYELIEELLSSFAINAQDIDEGDLDEYAEGIKSYAEHLLQHAYSTVCRFGVQLTDEVNR